MEDVKCQMIVKLKYGTKLSGKIEEVKKGNLINEILEEARIRERDCELKLQMSLLDIKRHADES